MRIQYIKAELEDEDTIDARILAKNVSIGVFANGNVMVCNGEEERLYHLRKTKHGGFELKEGTLL